MTSKKLFKNILRTTEQYFQGKAFQSQTAEQIMKRLGFTPQHKETFTEVLQHLVSQGIAVRKGDRYDRTEEGRNIIRGIVRMHPRGFGFVQPDKDSGYTEDVFIPPTQTLNAVDGDRVEIEINPVVSSKGPEGKLLSILERSRKQVAGIIYQVGQQHAFAFSPLLGDDHPLLIEDPVKLKVGDRVVMEVLEWGGGKEETTCRVKQHLGPITDPSADVPAAVEEFGLRSDFPPEVVAEAKKFGKNITKTDYAEREDLRDLDCLTIDPETAEDFDDAISISKEKNGNYRLGVHIADVSHFVMPGTELDKEAKLRANSTYFPGICIPMLPKELSAHLCSLKPNTNRLAVSVLMTLDADGVLLDHKILRSVIRSKKRFTYSQAYEVLQGKKISPFKKELQLMEELCGVLKRVRAERGSIEFAIPEVVIYVDDHGMPTHTRQVFYDITHQMIEEFMLKANEVVATHLTGIGKDLAYRVHEEPSEDNMQSFSVLASSFGFNLPENPTTADYQEMFDEAMQTPYGEYIAQAYIRSMRMAEYSPKNIGHYGLSLTHYCHFTSPIRRYVDLVIHRTLFGEEMESRDLEEIAIHCSAQERISAKAEQNVLLLKKLRLLKRTDEEEPHKQYEAVITRVKNNGLHFELTELLLTGFIHISAIGDDYYIFDQNKSLLIGEATGQKFYAGEKITVMIREIDLIRQEASWHLVAESPQRRKKKHRRK